MQYEINPNLGEGIMNRRIAGALLVIAMLGSVATFAGCTKKEKTVAGALIGAGAGAGIGAAAGNTTGGLIGGGLGALTGGLIGNSMKDDK